MTRAGTLPFLIFIGAARRAIWVVLNRLTVGEEVWHGDGKIPYFMTGDATSRSSSCVKRIAANPNGAGN
jgi:hypothetical protein